jgi:hypothetical protein
MGSDVVLYKGTKCGGRHGGEEDEAGCLPASQAHNKHKNYNPTFFRLG